jgi:hypothetical protein
MPPMVTISKVCEISVKHKEVVGNKLTGGLSLESNDLGSMTGREILELIQRHTSWIG